MRKLMLLLPLCLLAAACTSGKQTVQLSTNTTLGDTSTSSVVVVTSTTIYQPPTSPTSAPYTDPGIGPIAVKKTVDRQVASQVMAAVQQSAQYYMASNNDSLNGFAQSFQENEPQVMAQLYSLSDTEVRTMTPAECLIAPLPTGPAVSAASCG